MVQQSNITTSLLYPEVLAVALVRFAQKNERFKEHLAAVLDITTHVAENVENAAFSSLEVLMPKTLDQAVARTGWILSNYADTRAPQILAYAIKDKEYEDPKAIVLGMILGIEPYGVMGHDKPGGKVTQIVRDDIRIDKNVVKAATKTSLRLLDRAIAEANGELKKIETDVADWFFGEKDLEFFTASTETLKTVRRELEKLQVPYTTLSDEKGLSTLAISPAINPETASLMWDLFPIDNDQK